MLDALSPVTESFDSVVADRRSVRGYLDKRVPHDELRHILKVAQRSPSNCNIQPWHVYIASGSCRDRIRDQFIKLVQNDAPGASEYPEEKRFQGEYRERQVDCAVAMFRSMGIGREDREARRQASLRNYEFFDAPHVAFIGMPKEYGPILMLDVGMYSQTLMLTMAAHGLASCPQTSVCEYPDVVREEFGIGEHIVIVIGIAFGYEDVSMPVNDTRVPRVDLDASVTIKD